MLLISSRRKTPIALLLFIILFFSIASESEPTHNLNPSVRPRSRSNGLRSRHLTIRNDHQNVDHRSSTNHTSVSTILMESLFQFGLTPIPRVEMYAIFFEIAAELAKISFFNQTLPKAIDFAYGQLKLSIVSSKELTWEIVRSALDQIRALIDSGALVGFFEISVECMRVVWIWVVFGIPMYMYLGTKEDRGNGCVGICTEALAVM